MCYYDDSSEPTLNPSVGLYLFDIFLPNFLGFFNVMYQYQGRPISGKHNSMLFLTDVILILRYLLNLKFLSGRPMI